MDPERGFAGTDLGRVANGWHRGCRWTTVPADTFPGGSIMGRSFRNRFVSLLGLALLSSLAAPLATAENGAKTDTESAALAPPPVSEAERKQALADLRAHGYPITDGSQFLNAAAQNDLEAVRLFLRSGMPVDTKDDRDHATTALINATFMDQPEMALLLLEAGADVNANNGTTPLMNAAGKCDMTEVVRILIDRGADLDARAPGGATPLGMAKLFNCEENEKLLRKAGATADLAAPGSKQQKAGGKSGHSSAGKVKMPDPWSKLKVGAWVQYRFTGDASVDSRMKWTVKKVTPEKVVYLVESTTTFGQTTVKGVPTEMAYDRTRDWTADDVKVTRSEATLTLKGKAKPVQIYTTEGTDANGDHFVTRTWMSDEVPFGMVKTEVNGTLSQEAVDWGWSP
jgi:uncharacterized protein